MTEDLCIVGCVRVADMEVPSVASDMRYCEKCGMAVWLARSTPGDRGMIYCLPCTVDAVAEGDDTVIEPLTTEQLADIGRRQ